MNITLNNPRNLPEFTLAYNADTDESCKGLVFRGYNKTFKTKKGVSKHQGIKLLKRLSCPGCDHCGFMEESYSNAISDDYLIMPEIEDGGLYSVMLTNESRDWESGIVDSYDVEIYKLEEGL